MVHTKRNNELFVTLSTKPKQPKYSFGGRYASTTATGEIPGPGAYNPPPVASGGRLRTAPAITICGKSREYGFGKGQDSPGPGAYTLPSSLRPISALRSSAGFGTTERNTRPRGADVPPPGSYDLGSVMGREGPKISIRGKPRYPPSAAGSPVGPGAYYNADFLGHKRGYNFGQGHRSWKTSGAGDMVGPGSYNLPETMGTGLAVSIKSRLKFKSHSTDAPILGPWTQFGY